MSKLNESFSGAPERSHRFRRQRFEASSFFLGSPPSILFDDEVCELQNISGGGVGAVAPSGSDEERLREINRTGVLRLMQSGQELYKGVARLVRTDAFRGGVFAGFALDREELDLADLQRRNADAVARATAEIATATLRDVNRFLRNDRVVEAFLGDEASLSAELNRVLQRFLRGDIISGMADGRDVLLKARADFGPAEWRDRAVEIVRGHDLAALVLRCPLTMRSFERPRGYSGDAPLLDQIYGLGDATLWPHPSTVAGQVSFFVVHSSACRAVRRRRELLASAIDAACARAGAPATILSVACGHLRELDLSKASRSGGVGLMLALDQDPDSLKEVRRSVRNVRTETIEGSVRNLLANKIRFENVDFAYAAGLLDYLVAPVAMRLIERMFSYLKPGGRLLVANFTPAGEDIGYMETFMNWWLIYRTREELAALFAGLPEDQVASTSFYEDEYGVVCYAEAVKK